MPQQEPKYDSAFIIRQSGLPMRAGLSCPSSALYQGEPRKNSVVVVKPPGDSRQVFPSSGATHHHFNLDLDFGLIECLDAHVVMLGIAYPRGLISIHRLSVFARGLMGRLHDEVLRSSSIQHSFLTLFAIRRWRASHIALDSRSKA